MSNYPWQSLFDDDLSSDDESETDQKIRELTLKLETMRSVSESTFDKLTNQLKQLEVERQIAVLVAKHASTDNPEASRRKVLKQLREWIRDRYTLAANLREDVPHRAEVSAIIHQSINVLDKDLISGLVQDFIEPGSTAEKT